MACWMAASTSGFNPSRYSLAMPMRLPFTGSFRWERVFPSAPLLVESMGSYRQIWSYTKAVSSTLVVMGPIWSRLEA